MGELKVPTCGRIVHYFPTAEEAQALSLQSVLPAIVIDQYDTYPTLNVQTGNELHPVVVRKTVAHKSSIIEGQAYWDWPEIK